MLDVCRVSTGICDDVVHDYKLGVGTSSVSQMAQNLDTVLIRPVVEDGTQDKYRWPLHGLWFEEVVRYVKIRVNISLHNVMI